MISHDERARAWRSLQGVAVGDAFGQRFFGSEDLVLGRIAARALPTPEWRFTDDTVMAISIYEVLDQHGRIDQDALAERFARRYVEEPGRGYGGGAHGLLAAIARGASWREEAAAMFEGTGSYGNGSAMRVAPLGAFFADSLPDAVEQARLSALVTHAHAEGVAGAIATAVAAAVVAREPFHRSDFFDTILEHTPESRTRDGIAAARDLPPEAGLLEAAEALGTGWQVAAFDTVPFCLWCVAEWRHDFEAAMWNTVAGLGDRDTTCAIVGGIVALVTPPPEEWLRATEPLPLERRSEAC